MALAKRIGLDSKSFYFLPTLDPTPASSGQLAVQGSHRFPEDEEFWPGAARRRKPRRSKRRGRSAEGIPSGLASVDGRRYGSCHGDGCLSWWIHRMHNAPEALAGRWGVHPMPHLDEFTERIRFARFGQKLMSHSDTLHDIALVGGLFFSSHRGCGFP